MLGCPEVSSHRAREIVRDIALSSRPRGRFFVLLITASLIASFGLIANSSAVIIGAMLVSPLMTPIFGAALGMLRGNPRLLGQALRSEVVGVVLAIGAAYLVGLPRLSLDGATAEMLARTQPNLLDMLVAIFAGFAGAYALLDERVSPALPGVAIATAIVPPLSTCGLCLSLGAWPAAGGAFLLFLANFVSILLVGLIVFWLGGLARRQRYTVRRFVAHFGPTTAAFAVIAVVFTNSLLRIADDRRLESSIQNALNEQLSARNDAHLQDWVHTKTPDGLQVLATVRSHRTISPSWVTAMEEAIESATQKDADLVVRTLRSRDVCALGSSLRVETPGPTGAFLVAAADDFEAREALAAQVVREFFEDEPGFELTRVEYGVSPDDEGVIVAYTNAIRRLTRSEVISLEGRLQLRLDDPTLHLFVRVNAAHLQGRDGSVLVEWNNVRDAGQDEAARLPMIEEQVRYVFEALPSTTVLKVHFNWSEDRWRTLVEVISPGDFSPMEVAALRESLPAEIANDVELNVWRRTELIVGETGVSDYERLVEGDLDRRRDKLRRLFRTSASLGRARNASADVNSLAFDE